MDGGRRTATWIALLRGINVGGARRVAMAPLRELVAGLGYDRVRTYVQSGNVVFDAGGRAEDGDAVAARLGAAVADAFGFAVDVVVRSRDELAAVVAANPFPAADAAPTRLHVIFCDRPIDPDAALAGLDLAAFAPDACAIAGREAYVWTPDGFGRSKLAEQLGRRPLAAAATARNWRTVQRLLALADER